MIARNRVPEGVTTGGQYTTGARAESDVALGVSPDPQTKAAQQLRDKFADLLGVDPDVVDVELSRDVGCGAPADSRGVHMVAPVQGDQADEKAGLSALVFPDGQARDLGLNYTWETVDTGHGVDRDGVGLPFDTTRTADDLPRALAQLRDQRDMQKALDSAINTPQRVSKPEQDYFKILHAAASHDRHGSRVVEFQAGLSSRKAAKVTFAPDHGVTGVRLETEYGEVSVADQDADKVLRRLDIDLIFALGEDSTSITEGRVGTESFTERMGKILPAHLDRV